MEDIWTNIARRIAGESGPSDQEKTEAWFNNNKKSIFYFGVKQEGSGYSLKKQ